MKKYWYVSFLAGVVLVLSLLSCTSSGSGGSSSGVFSADSSGTGGGNTTGDTSNGTGGNTTSDTSNGTGGTTNPPVDYVGTWMGKVLSITKDGNVVGFQLGDVTLFSGNNSSMPATFTVNNASWWIQDQLSKAPTNVVEGSTLFTASGYAAPSATSDLAVTVSKQDAATETKLIITVQKTSAPTTTNTYTVNINKYNAVSNVYGVYTILDFYNLRQVADASYKQMNDLDFLELNNPHLGTTISANGWTEIPVANLFNYDGNLKRIYNIKYNNISYNSSFSLFNTLAAQHYLKDLYLEVDVTTQTLNTLGVDNKGSIERVTVKGNLSYAWAASGLVSTNTGSIRKALFKGNITPIPGTGISKYNGMVELNSGIIASSAFLGNIDLINIPGDPAGASTIAQKNNIGGSIQDCYAKGSFINKGVLSNDNFSGLVYTNSGGTLNRNFADMTGPYNLVTYSGGLMTTNNAVNIVEGIQNGYYIYGPNAIGTNPDVAPNVVRVSSGYLQSNFTGFDFSATGPWIFGNPMKLNGILY